MEAGDGATGTCAGAFSCQCGKSLIFSQLATSPFQEIFCAIPPIFPFKRSRKESNPATVLSAMVFNNKEYKVYKYALECVEDDLKFPSTATYPSFKNTELMKSKYGTEIIIGSYTGGKSFEYAWDVSGSGTCENALGMKLNYNFTVTVVEDEYGDFWCYKCVIN